jgi:hypothetical protein
MAAVAYYTVPKISMDGRKEGHGVPHPDKERRWVETLPERVR